MVDCNIIFTGGGSGGHVMTALSIIKSLDTLVLDHKIKFKVEYIGGVSGIEKEIVERNKIPYYGIQNGKLRRYLSFYNLIDLFKIFVGIWESFFILGKFDRKKTIVFATGGFVAVPVVIASWLRCIPSFIHEQTTRVGLANKICSFFAGKVFVSFEESIKFFPKNKTILSGYPLRDECFLKKINSVTLDDFIIAPVPGQKILFATGGGNGSLLVNNLIKKNLDWLSKEFVIIHQVGEKFIDEYKRYQSPTYKVIKFLDHGMIDLLKMSDVVISRAGAGTVCELMTLGKKSIFIPLKIAQKNEQYHNAMAAHQKLGSIVIEEDNLEKVDIKKLIQEVLAGKKELEVNQNIRAQKIIGDELVQLVKENQGP